MTKQKTLTKNITPKKNNTNNAQVKKSLGKKQNTSKTSFPKSELKLEKTNEPQQEDSLSPDNYNKVKSPPSQNELDNKDMELHLNENSYSSEDKKDSLNNNTASEKNSLETNSQKELIKKPFNRNGLLSKCHLKLASYIEQNKDVTLAGTKRFTDKSGEYYLKNVQLRKKKGQGALSKRLSLRTPQNLENCFNKLHGNLNKIKKSATKIVTVLPENSLTPIPVKERNSVRGVAGIFNKKQYQNAERTAVFIRRMEYSSGVQKHLKPVKRNNDFIKKIITIQEWWKTMYKILRLQKCIRGFLFRRKLMKNLEHQERLLQFITEFDNIHGYHLYKKFFNNLKQMVNQINSKKTEMLEDFSEKMEKIENMNNMKKLKNKLMQWKKIADEEKKMENAKKFYENKIMGKIMENLKNAHNLAKADNDLTKGISKLNKLFNDKYKKKFMDKLKQLSKNKDLKDFFDKWKSLINKKKIFKKLLKLKKKELKNRFTIDSNVNNLSIKDDDNNRNNTNKNISGDISISNENSINILKKDSPEKILSVGNPGLDFSIIPPETSDKNKSDKNKNKSILKKNNKNKDLEKAKNKLAQVLNNLIKNRKNDNDDNKLGKAFQKWKDFEISINRKQNYNKIKLKLIKGNKDGNADKNKKNNFTIVPKVIDFEIIAKKKNRYDNNALPEKNNKKNKKKLPKKDDINMDKKGNNNDDDNMKNKSIYKLVNPKNIKKYYLNGKGEANEIDLDLDSDGNRICHNEPFTLERAYSDNDDNDDNEEENEKKAEDETNDKKGKKLGRKKLPKILIIQKDNSFSIIDGKYVDDKLSPSSQAQVNNKIKNVLNVPTNQSWDGKNKNTNYDYDDNNISATKNNNLEKSLLNKLNNEEGDIGDGDETQIEKYDNDNINKVNEINEFFPGQESNDKLSYISQKTDNFILGPNISEIIKDLDLNKNLENNNLEDDEDTKIKNKLALEKLSKRKIVPFNNILKCPVELFSIICKYNKNKNLNNNLLNENMDNNLTDKDKDKNKDNEDINNMNDKDNIDNKNSDLDNKSKNNDDKNKDNEDINNMNNKDNINNKNSDLDNKSKNNDDKDKDNKDINNMNDKDNNINKNLDLDNRSKNDDDKDKDNKDINNMNDKDNNIKKISDLDNKSRNNDDNDGEKNNKSLEDDLLNKSSQKDKNDLLGDDNDYYNYKLYHAGKFSLYPKDYIPNEDTNSENEDESKKIIDLPLFNNKKDKDKNKGLYKKKDRKPFDNLNIINDQSFSIFGKDKNKNKNDKNDLNNKKRDNEKNNKNKDNDELLNNKKNLNNKNKNYYRIKDNNSENENVYVRNKLMGDIYKKTDLDSLYKVKNINNNIEDNNNNKDDDNLDKNENANNLKNINKDEDLNSQPENNEENEDNMNKNRKRFGNADTIKKNKDNNINDKNNQIEENNKDNDKDDFDKNKNYIDNLEGQNSDIDNKNKNNNDNNDINDNNDFNDNDLTDKDDNLKKDGKHKRNKDKNKSKNKNDNNNLDNSNEEDNNIDNNKKLKPQYNILSTEKIDLMFHPEQTDKKDKNKNLDIQIVKENDLNIFDNNDNKNKQNVFSVDKQDIQKFDVLIEPENIPTKSDFENQTLNDEYLISKQKKNQFTIYSDPNKKNLQFNKDSMKFDSNNSFSIKLDKNNLNLKDILKKNALKKVLDNLLTKKKLHKLIKDLSNNKDINNNDKNFILKHFLNKWKENALINKSKKRISDRKKSKSIRGKYNKYNRFNKNKKIQKKNLKKYFKKWRDIALNPDKIITPRKLLQKLINYKKNKKYNKNNVKDKNEDLENKLRKALLQSLLRIYKNKINKILLKYLNIWKTKKNESNIRRFLYGKKNLNFSQDKVYSYLSHTNKFDNFFSNNNSNMDSNSSKAKKYYSSKVSKYNSMDKGIKDKMPYKKNMKYYKSNEKYYNKYNNINCNDPLNQDKNTYILNDDYLRNMSFRDQLLAYDSNGNLIPNVILEKIHRRTEKYSHEYQNSVMSDSSDPNYHRKNVSMIQRIKKIYRSPNDSMNSYYSNKDIYVSDNNFCQKKNKSKVKIKNETKIRNIEEKKEQNSDDNSLNNSTTSGIYLKGAKTENLKPIIYTSQSFFIDKNTINSDPSELQNISYYRNITNKYPMKMKGDFSKLIEKNPEILKQKNPRIQVTNATCELEQFDEREFFQNKNINKNINLLKLDPNLSEKIENKYNKNGELTRVVYNCDRDIYESQLPYETQKQSWISMSIPLKNDVAKWEFLNGVKGERYKNNANKFELIQKERYIKNSSNRHIKLVEKKRGNESKSLSKISEESITNVQYKLREMNYSQFYKSPIRAKSKTDEGNSGSSPPVKLVKKDKNSYKKRTGPYHSRFSSLDKNSKNSYVRDYFEESENSYE